MHGCFFMKQFIRFGGSYNSPLWFNEGTACFIPLLMIERIGRDPPKFWIWDYSEVSISGYNTLIENAEKMELI